MIFHSIPGVKVALLLDTVLQVSSIKNLYGSWVRDCNTVDVHESLHYFDQKRFGNISQFSSEELAVSFFCPKFHKNPETISGVTIYGYRLYFIGLLEQTYYRGTYSS